MGEPALAYDAAGDAAAEKAAEVAARRAAFRVIQGGAGAGEGAAAGAAEAGAGAAATGAAEAGAGAGAAAVGASEVGAGAAAVGAGEVGAGAAAVTTGAVVAVAAVAVVAVVGLGLLGYYLYKRSHPDMQPNPNPDAPPSPNPPTQVDCPTEPAPQSPGPSPSSGPQLGQSTPAEPVMPPDLSPDKREKWRDCKSLHDEYKQSQADGAEISKQLKPLLNAMNKNPGDLATRLQICELLDQLIEQTKNTDRGRRKYIENGCDEFDWFNEGRTEAERRADHENQLDDVEQSIKNLYKQKKELCG